MKTTLLFLSFLLFAFSTTSLLVAADDTLDPVLDSNGDELQAGERYYALPLIWAMGGGLTLSRNINGSLCPLNVVQSPSEIDNGYPLTFTPLDKGDVIRVSSPLDIEFLNIPTYCREPTVWTVEGSFITTNGKGGNAIRNFRIQKYRKTPMAQTYKFVYCVARMACQDIGRSSVNGVRALTLLVEPYEMVFVKVATEAELDCLVKSSWKGLGRDVDGVSFIIGLPFEFML
ncbi:hypothetical protein F0562_001748 [Nyssa sinensis]|uniref:Uncharacterized protein n=1 Tax=Nyssa sinensis TaxID=561372 RepID=A0A5J5C5E1_9ASTE|nr:hypothetical protein F0562_001748 [Nyssa sinensis]